MVLTARVSDLRLPAISLTVTPALTSAAALAPPAGRTWRTGVRTDPEAFDGRRMAALILDTMWRTARLRQFDAYVGNPDPTGPARTTYRFRLAPPPAAVAAPAARASGGPLGTVGAVAAAVLLLLGAVVAWSRS